MSIKRASNQLEQLCHIKDLLIFEREIGYQREIIPVITEYSCATLDFGAADQYEFFRARGVHTGARSTFHTWHNQVSVTICHVTCQIKIGPTGQLIMSKQGIGLGPALMACVLTWLQNRGIPDYTVDPGFLSLVDAATPAAREQRNRFYMAFGFTLSNCSGTETGLEVIEGSFTAANVQALSIPDRYQGRLQPWFDFERRLCIERESGALNLVELKSIDWWTYRMTWLGRSLLRVLGWPVQFCTRHKHEPRPWEPKSSHGQRR
ncbi:hypothetical protein J4P02_27960 [Pseudomonas sp. NFXW11]|uniref:hypothetical protein n=1 Tax=Pseudomonas sp. NFXW11 TaxID=2819531 RepID=UPI003CF1A33A